MASETSPRLDDTPFPTLRDSPLWVAEPTVRERWWFADGAWLNQGTLGAPVSFGLTQWCADRGLEGAVFDETYALELHREMNRAQGQPEDANLGEDLETGIRILVGRGLVAGAYACRDLDATVAAVLDYGPVLASLRWYESFMEPDRSGRTAVIHAPDDRTATVGGHVVLVDGIDRDLSIEGATGFVRLKLTWSRDWGDAGHCLISLADFETAMDQAFLLTPAPSALPTGVSAAVAITAERPSFLAADPDLVDVRYADQSMGSDRWTVVDTLGYAPHAEAIARAITHRDTGAPLTIGIKGPWGAGKTSLMRMVRERLEWPVGRPLPRNGQPEWRQLHLLNAPNDRVTNRMLLKALRRPDRPPPEAAPDIDALHAAQDEQRWRPTVWFNPWMYQTGEQVWAGLAHEIIAEITGRMSVGEREQFWLRLNRKRIDEQAVRRRIYGVVASRALPWVAAAIVLLVVGVVVAATTATGLGAAVAALGPVVAAAAGLTKADSVLGESAQGIASDILGPSPQGELVRSPDYEAASGPLFLVRADLGRVLDLVVTSDRPLVVFIDDLDRCSPGTVVQVIEALNVFVAGDYPNSMFVVSMEPDMVAAHIEAAYGPLVAKLATLRTDGEQAFDLGWRFLEKIVQLPLTLPTISAEHASQFLTSLLSDETGGPTEEAAAPSEAAVRVAEAALTGATVGGMLGAVGDPDAVGGVDERATQEAVRRLVERRVSVDSPEVKDAVEYAAPHLDHNPREIKRFVNVFRYFMMLAVERRPQHRDDGVAFETLAAKLAVLAIRWPALLTPLTAPVAPSGASALSLVEKQTPAALRKQLAAGGFGDVIVTRLCAAELREFLRASPRIGDTIDGFL